MHITVLAEEGLICAADLASWTEGLVSSDGDTWMPGSRIV